MTNDSPVCEQSDAQRTPVARTEPIVPDREGFIQGVWVGRQIADATYAQPQGEGRWVVRGLDGPALVRLGEVMGGGDRFTAMTMKGDIVAVEVSLKQACVALVSRRRSAQRKPPSRRSRT